jgi:amino acid transporter
MKIMKTKISLLSLVLLIVAGIDSIRTLPTTAFFGSSLVFFYFLSALAFLFPVAFVSAEFSSRYPNEGGVFHWVRHAFGDRAGLLTVWLQWINTMVWYPTMLLFIGGTASYLLHPSLAQDKIFLLATSLVTFWGLTLLNMKGIQMSVRINSFCGAVGTLIPMCFLVLLAVWWGLSSKPMAISLSPKDLIPSFNFMDSGSAIVTIMASFLGMELAGVHVGDIQNPEKNFPKAIGYSVLILLGTLIFGALAIAVVIPQQDIQFIDGVMQTFTTFLTAFQMPYLVPVLALLIIIGATGGSVNWLLSPAKGLLQVAGQGFLPSFFLAQNKHGVPTRILILQAVVVSVFCCAIQLVPSVNTYYWFLMALSTGLYMLMYVFLFLAAIKLKRPATGYKIPRGIRTVSCLTGLVACLITIIVGFLPTSEIAITNRMNYVLLIVVGFGLMLSPVIFLWRYKKKREVSEASLS